MGAGNRYTTAEDSDMLAIQVDVPMVDEEYADIVDSFADMVEDLIAHLLLLPACNKPRVSSKDSVYYGKFYVIKFKPNYNGDAVVIDLEYDKDVEPRCLGLQRHNYAASYAKIARYINSEYPVFEGLGYTRSSHGIGELK